MTATQTVTVRETATVVLSKDALPSWDQSRTAVSSAVTIGLAPVMEVSVGFQVLTMTITRRQFSGVDRCCLVTSQVPYTIGIGFTHC